MTTVEGSEPAEKRIVRLDTLARGDDRLDAVLRLHRSAKATLGPMPTEGFQDRVDAGTLIVALIDDQIAGYVLYDLPRERVKIVHLCVAKRARQHGIARALVAELRSRHAPLYGIEAHCRRDFEEASAAWEALGFRPERDRPGRSIAGHPLTIWWLDFGHENLFSLPARERDLAAVDQAVYEDLVTGRREGSESRRLMSDWVEESVQFCVTDEVHRESNRCTDAALRQKLMTSLGGWRHIARGVSPSESIVRRISELTPRAGAGDHRHVALALAGGAAYFVTRDQDLLAGAEAIDDEYRLRVLRPEWLIRELDRVRRTDGYEPAALQATRFQQGALLAGGTDEFVDALLNSAAGERKAAFDAVIRQSLALPDTDSVLAVRDENGRTVAGMVTRMADGGLLVRAVRVRGADRVSRTLGRNVLGQIRITAARQGLAHIHLVDPNASSVVIDALQAEGFGERSDGWWCEVERGLVDDAGADVGAAGRRELDHWPVKVFGSGVQTFLVPIEATFAEQLFDTEFAAETLLDRESQLGLSRELVYYRSPLNGGFLTAPGRVLWYAKRSRHRGWPGGIRALSLLQEVVVDKPRTLFSRNEHLGAWNQQQVLDAARDGRVMALRLANTEVFERPLRLAEMRSLFAQHGARLQLQGPSRVPEHMFRLIYPRCSAYA